MKHIYACAVLLALMVPVLPAWAETEERGGETVAFGTVSIAADQSVRGNYYGLGNLFSTVVISGRVEGDAILTGGTVTVNGEVSDDVLIFGGTVGIHGPVGEDVRILGGDVTIADTVGGSVAVLGGTLKVLSTASVAGDVLVYGGNVTIEGEVAGQVLGNAEQIRIDGMVGGVDVTTRALTLGEQASITNDVRYVSSQEVVRATGAVVSGSLSRSDVPATPTREADSRMILIPFLVSLFASLSLYLLFRDTLERFTAGITRRFGVSALLGAGTLILVPVASMVMIVSVLGSLVGLMSLFMYLLGAVLALSLMSVVMGSVLSTWVTKTPNINVLWITLGAISIQIMLLIPILGPALVLSLFIVTLGGLVYGLHRVLR